MDVSPDSAAAAFPSTRLSLVQLAANPGHPDYRAAWERFFRCYWPPLYAWLRRSGSSRQDALDLLQDFFVKGIEDPVLAKFDPARGRLRSFLLSCLRNQRIDAVRHQQARPDRQPIPFLSGEGIEMDIADPSPLDPDAAFEQEWAGRVLSQAIAAAEERFRVADDASSIRVLHEWVLPSERPPVDQLADSLSMTPGTLYTRATRVRQAVQGEVFALVEVYAGQGAGARGEVEDLLAILAGGAA